MLDDKRKIAHGNATRALKRHTQQLVPFTGV
jgi:hypothetical protein